MIFRKKEKVPQHMKPMEKMDVILLTIAILTIIFTIVQIIVFCIKGQEMSTLIDRWFTIVGLEFGGLLAKSIINKKMKNQQTIKYKKKSEDVEDGY